MGEDGDGKSFSLNTGPRKGREISASYGHDVLQELLKGQRRVVLVKERMKKKENCAWVECEGMGKGNSRKCKIVAKIFLGAREGPGMSSK